MKKPCGLSLIEILLALSLIALLLIGFTSSNFTRIHQSTAINSSMKRLVGAIALARVTAISEGKTVTFCRSNDGMNCQGKWHDGSIVFTDRNADRKINEDDRLIYSFQGLNNRGELSFNSFQNKQYLQMTSRGMTNYQSGNFTFCPANKDPKLIRQIVINQIGRTRFARDTDGDGIVEDSRGKPISCD